jgi:hypothetical protein
MSNQEYCQVLHQEYFETSQAFLSLDRQVSLADGVNRLVDLSDYTAIKRKGQAAIHKYCNFLMLLKKKRVNPNDEVQLP